MFEVLAALKKESLLTPTREIDSKGEDDIIMNVATGDRISTCAALSASYVNGIRAFAVVGDQVMLLPMLKFSFNKLVSENKVEIIRALSGGAPKSFEELSKTLRISAPLLSYHLNGDRDTAGLVELGLVEVVSPSSSPASQDETNGSFAGTNSSSTGKRVKLSSMGNLFFKGYCG